MWWVQLWPPRINLEKPSATIRAQALALTSGLSRRRDRALALHNFVRDNIQFGFTPYFDWATPEDTLRLRRGHCNPQTALLVALLNAAQVPAKQHFVLIPRSILKGLAPGLPQTLLHSYTEVNVADGAEDERLSLIHI